MSSPRYRYQQKLDWLVYLEALFELLGDEVEDDGIDTGVDGGQVVAEVVQH